MSTVAASVVKPLRTVVQNTLSAACRPGNVARGSSVWQATDQRCSRHTVPVCCRIMQTKPKQKPETWIYCDCGVSLCFYFWETIPVRWEAERAATADLQGRAAAAVGLHDQVRASAAELSRTQAELDSARSELEHERRRRDTAENELNDVRGEVGMGRAAGCGDGLVRLGGSMNTPPGDYCRSCGCLLV